MTEGKAHIGIRLLSVASAVVEAGLPVPSRPVPRLVLPGVPQAESTGFVHDPGKPTDANWDRYCLWRESKCPPSKERDAMDEINQATLEFVGELAELSYLVGENGGEVVVNQDLTARLVDEAGDAFFTGAWCLDAWGVNYLRGYDFSLRSGVGILNDKDLVTERAIREAYLPVLVSHDEDPQWVPSPDFIKHTKIFEHYSVVAALSSLAHAGMTANSLKKLLYQRRDQDARRQCEFIMVALSGVERLLIMVGKTIGDALRSNISKLDHRYPHGYVGPGGGDRTGAGR